MTQTSPETINFLRRLRAIREFTSQPIADDVLCDILDVARWTSTAANRQTTEVVVVRDPALLQKFGEWGARPAAGAPLALLLVTSGDGAFDEGRVGERLALAAAAHGLGSVIATLKNEGPDETKKLLGIPEDRRARYLVALGNIDRDRRAAAPRNPNAGRKPLNEFAHWDRF